MYKYAAHISRSQETPAVFFMHSLLTSSVVVVLSVFVLVYVTHRRRSRLPPGPKGLPILGNVFDVPKSFEWVKSAEWSRQYGMAKHTRYFADVDLFFRF